MQQHGSKYFARRPLPNYPTSDPGDWSHLVKGQLFQNMVTLYIKLKIITNAATEVKVKLFQNMVTVHIKFKRITNTAAW